MRKIRVEIIETVTASISKRRTGHATIHLPEGVRLNSDDMCAYVQELYAAGEVSVKNWSPYKSDESDEELVTIDTGEEEEIK